jgi:hypothetical protein
MIGEGSSCTSDGYEGRAASDRSGVVAGLDGMTVGSVGEDGGERQPSSCGIGLFLANTASGLIVDFGAFPWWRARGSSCRESEAMVKGLAKSSPVLGIGACRDRVLTLFLSRWGAGAGL